MTLFRIIGLIVLNSLAFTGKISLFSIRSFKAILTPPFFIHQTWQQIIRMGYFSLPVIGMTAIFTGGALALNIYTGGSRFNAEQFLPNIVVVGLTRELGPVLAALMLAGRVSASIAAEIGTMRVTEQIDALETLSTDPYQYLIAPRILAALISLPLLVLIADIIGVMGGFIVSTQLLEFNPTVYLKNTLDFVTSWDVISGLIKAIVFGYIIALMGCYYGFYSDRGAKGVGLATTNAVVGSAILIFTANYLLTTLFV